MKIKKCLLCSFLLEEMVGVLEVPQETRGSLSPLSTFFTRPENFLIDAGAIPNDNILMEDKFVPFFR